MGEVNTRLKIRVAKKIIIIAPLFGCGCSETKESKDLSTEGSLLDRKEVVTRGKDT